MMRRRTNNVFTALTHWHDYRLRIFVEGMVVGLVAGIVVVAFRYMLQIAGEFRISLYPYLRRLGLAGVALWVTSALPLGYALGRVVNYEPMSSGSGIPQVKGILLGHMRMNWLRVVVTKFIGGVIALGAGLSVGREGPSVQLGASVGQGVSRLLGRMRIEERYLITSGASAGLAAAFNAPLAGVIFALEELHKNFSPAVLTSAMAAALTADLVTLGFFGHHPVFDFHTLPILPTTYYPHLVAIAAMTGVLGVAFNRCLTATLDLYKHQRFVPRTLVPAIPIAAAGVLAFVLPETLGGGHLLIESISHESFSLLMLLVLLVVKFGFTMASYGSGVPGGIFLPLLVIGALIGGIYGHVATHILHVDPEFANNFVVEAMAAYFTAIVKAPITGTILITEMTGSFSHLLSLITVSMTAYLVSDLLHGRPVYEELLERALANRHGGDPSREHRKATVEVSVCLGSELDRRRVRDVKWPSHCLLVGIRRGETEIIPKGETRILAGDCIYVLVDEDEVPKVNEVLLGLAGECAPVR